MEDPTLEEMLEIKQAIALKEKIDEKTKVISNTFGRDHSSFYSGGGGGLSGDGIDFSEKGKIYENERFKIKSVIDQDKYQETEISLITRTTRPFLHFFKTTSESSEVVYMQRTREDLSEIIIFKKEDEWLGDFNKLYDKSLIQIKISAESSADSEKRQKTQEIAQNFGLEKYL